MALSLWAALSLFVFSTDASAMTRASSQSLEWASGPFGELASRNSSLIRLYGTLTTG
ncbi:MAG: hypothetical protein QXD84_02470 [Thermoplasmata archaeon]